MSAPNLFLFISCHKAIQSCLICVLKIHDLVAFLRLRGKKSLPREEFGAPDPDDEEPSDEGDQRFRSERRLTLPVFFLLGNRTKST